jgi:D-sedoheptulose 7-phosphate isomerase
MIEHCRVVESAMPHCDLLRDIADKIIECFNTGGRVYLFGNGGSAADAQHIAAELVGRFKKNRRALPAVALTTDTSILTAVSNDISADDCFARQVDALVTDRDVVWALSVSGTSPNIMAAVKRVRSIGAKLVGFTGRSGGDLKSYCDYCFCADHDSSDRVQEVHQLAYHLICERVEETFAMSTL